MPAPLQCALFLPPALALPPVYFTAHAAHSPLPPHHTIPPTPPSPSCRNTPQGNLVPLYERVMADQLTPVLAYRCLVKEDDREAPSFLFESVTNGSQQGRYSFVGAAPALEVVARGRQVHVMDHRSGARESKVVEDPMQVCGVVGVGV